ncbi:hypothetical protein TraAM80_06752 [Trypanosoma rangeli]|uniref:Uncharacterized protein n=1 Tax=Trypanosoma rangeli TaxID=5698 RepID=A0A422N911_TRYRA|nr:uncharacterized protein TraAM80_06752 [Trypanosoma rangeli]RNF01947.1 hypothetical protein TraAM80_06752 [Trypanosoma rangeli]|eukprot:RNF01947.1 hypothetical protein TraAM80_06752 [Trypanosoma rangeli]
MPRRLPRGGCRQGCCFTLSQTPCRRAFFIWAGGLPIILLAAAVFGSRAMRDLEGQPVAPPPFVNPTSCAARRPIGPPTGNLSEATLQLAERYFAQPADASKMLSALRSPHEDPVFPQQKQERRLSNW